MMIYRDAPPCSSHSYAHPPADRPPARPQLTFDEWVMMLPSATRTAHSISELRKWFRMLDTDDGGTVTWDEYFMWAVRACEFASRAHFRASLHTHTRANAHTHTHTRTHTHTHTHTRAHTRTRTHTHTHARAHRPTDPHNTYAHATHTRRARVSDPRPLLCRPDA